MTTDLLRAGLPVSVRAEAGEGNGVGQLHGHFAVTNIWTEIHSYWEGDFLERIAPKAFLRTLAYDRSQLRVLFQHGYDPVVGDKPIASIRTLREDEIGVYYEADLLDGVPDLIVAGLRAGQYGASFRFQVMREERVEEPEPSAYNPTGLPERTILEVNVREFGPVTWGAYPEATAGMRSLTDWYHAERGALVA